MSKKMIAIIVAGVLLLVGSVSWFSYRIGVSTANVKPQASQSDAPNLDNLRDQAARATPDAQLNNREVSLQTLGEQIGRYKGVTIFVRGTLTKSANGQDTFLQDEQGYSLKLDLSKYSGDANRFLNQKVKVKGEVNLEANTPTLLVSEIAR